jgi:hypothetical protein
MFHLAKSLMRFPITVSLYGMKQLADAVVPSTATKPVEDILMRAEAQLSRLMRETFKTGDRLTVETIDPMLALMTQDGLQSGHMIKTGFDLMRGLTEMFGTHLPGIDHGLAWREFTNKLESFGTFRYVDSVLNIPPQSDAPLCALIEKAVGLDPYLSVWATEGIGHYVTERAWQTGEPHALLTTECLPNHSAVALHAGMGLSLAKRCFATLTPSSPTGQLDDALRRFADLCAQNAQPGCFGIAFEALGLVAQTFMPELRLRLDRQITTMNPDWLDFFWHGVGRGAYFVPRSSVSWRAGALMPLRPPHDLARENVISGLAWPLALVNIRHPEIVAQFVTRHGNKLEESAAFAHGIAAALVVWTQATGGDPYFDGFAKHIPCSANKALVRRWQALIHNSIQEASRYAPDIRQHGQLEQLFRNQPLNLIATSF